MSTHRSVAALAAERAAHDPAGRPAAAHAPQVASDVYGTAREALNAIETKVAELASTVANLTDPEALAGEGNLAKFRYDLDREVDMLRACFDAVRDQHQVLRDHLA